MTKEELEREYYGRRPTEPYSEDDSPNDWANIVQYAEENLDKAFKAIAELEKENAELKANNQFLNNLVREKEQRGLEIQEDLLRENEKLKEQCSILADCNTCHSTCKNENIEMKKQFTKAKEIIKDYLTIIKGSHTTVCGVPEENRTIYVLKLNEEAEQFFKE